NTAAARTAASEGVGGTLFSSVDSSGIELIFRKLKELGPAFANVREDAAAVTKGIRSVDAAFGSASRSAEQFGTRVDILNGKNVSFIGTLKQMVNWQEVLTAGIHAFTGAIAGAVAGTEHLGRALLVGFLQIISEICVTLGTMFVLAAAGFIALPGFQWS